MPRHYHSPSRPPPTIPISSLTIQQQGWYEEVRYLHSLYHNSPYYHHQNQNPNKRNTTSALLHQPPNKIAKNNPATFPHLTPETFPNPIPESSSCNKWVETSITPLPETATWGVSITNLVPKSTPGFVSAEEEAKFLALKVQQKGLRMSQCLFSKSGSESDDGSEEEEEEGMGLKDVELEETDEYKFFTDLFKVDEGLKEYYEKNNEGGVFCCLVCNGIGNKAMKRFKDCVALVQHCRAICKTKRRNAHRAFGNVVCKVLGWNVNRLPSIVLAVDGGSGRVVVQNEGNDGLRVGELVNVDSVGGLTVLKDHGELGNVKQVGDSVNGDNDGILTTSNDHGEQVNYKVITTEDVVDEQGKDVSNGNVSGKMSEAIVESRDSNCNNSKENGVTDQEKVFEEASVM